MAKSPAKNMSSLDNHTMVPTLTMFGRFSECTRWVIADPEVPTALVTLRSMTLRRKGKPPGSCLGASMQVRGYSAAVEAAIGGRDKVGTWNSGVVSLVG
ncbi:hypothetical protein GCM10027068_37550 [Prescottella soli]